jgi:hypothetical protein
MSKPLERISYDSDATAQVHELTSALKAAIDRINELEAKYESQNHYLGAGFDYVKPTSRAKYPQADCPECNGTGFIGTDAKAQCSNCGGTGKVV